MRSRSMTLVSLVASVLTAPSAWAQGEVLSNASGRVDRSTGLSCPMSMLVVSVMSDGAFPEVIGCSAYNADGRRTGELAMVSAPYPQPTSVGGAAFEAAMTLFRSTKKTVSCPADRAVVSFGAHLDAGIVDKIDVICAGFTPSGGRTGGVTAGTLTDGTAAAVTTVLACPIGKFARGYLGNTTGMALTCVDPPIFASAVAGVALSAFSALGGTAVTGTVRLNAIAGARTSVSLSMSNAPGGIVPASVDVPSGAREATFIIESAANTAGCATITASLGQSTATAPLVITPQPPAAATFSLILLPETANSVFAAPSTITAAVVPRAATRPSVSVAKVASPTITFESDHPGVVAIQPTTQRSVADTVKVNLGALSTGCAVVTATVDGVTWRKTVRVAAGF